MQPKIRLQAADDLRPAPPRSLSLPSPEELGLQAPDSKPAPVPLTGPEELGLQVPAFKPDPVAKLDWNVTRESLNQLGALSFRLDKLTTGCFRMTFLLPTSDPGRTHLIETTAETEAAAVHVALEQGEQWAGKKPSRP